MIGHRVHGVGRADDRHHAQQDCDERDGADEEKDGSRREVGRFATIIPVRQAEVEQRAGCQEDDQPPSDRDPAERDEMDDAQGFSDRDQENSPGYRGEKQALAPSATDAQVQRRQQQVSDRDQRKEHRAAGSIGNGLANCKINASVRFSSHNQPGKGL